ncbi:DUF2478 domain-containing protein [Ruegeria pomeroyi]|nr:DUF2478 domain-containing protein [Ruegeria pomeroyi]
MKTLAGVSAEGRGATDRLLAAVVAQLQVEGIRVAGALRAPLTEGATSHCNSDLHLLPDGPMVRITQELGAGSTACRMDAGALELAVGLSTARLASEGAELVVLNKFGLSEAEGRGFRALIAEALSQGVPVLIGVSDAHRAAFAEFAQDLSTTLRPDEDTILAWCRAVISRAAPPVREA